MESCSTQAVLPLVGLAAEKVIRDRYNGPWGVRRGTTVQGGKNCLTVTSKPGNRADSASVSFSEKT
ncbi:MAG: hypothetical protein ACQESR_10700 [Planctomycetota bacterium]